MSDWTKNSDIVRLYTEKDTPETIYTFTALDWYEQRKAWINQGKFQEGERIFALINDFQYPGLEHSFNDEFCNALIKYLKGETE